MQAVAFYLLYPFIYLVSLSPFWILYRISDLVYVLMYKIIGYRKKVVFGNLENAFPEKSEKERLKIKMYAVHDSVFIEGTCDTIFVEKIIERKIPIRYYEAKKENDFKKWGGIILISFLIILILLIVYRLFKFFL